MQGKICSYIRFIFSHPNDARRLLCMVAILMTVVVLTTAAKVSHMRMEYAPKHVRVRVKTIVRAEQHVTAKPISISLFS